ncbi:hypothetical protein GBG21_01485 [Aeribacillus pallidus]|uniref:hypothetical protein n=1 Tax=Aeribacillus TaxID=1055323 RepID=UPI002E2456B9|nr:hypothetical protein [Aeribacillus composti]
MVEIDCLSFVEAVWHSSEEVVETLENLPPNKALLLHRKKTDVALGRVKKMKAHLHGTEGSHFPFKGLFHARAILYPLIFELRVLFNRNHAGHSACWYQRL